MTDGDVGDGWVGGNVASATPILGSSTLANQSTLGQEDRAGLGPAPTGWER